MAHGKHKFSLGIELLDSKEELIGYA